MRKKLKKIGLIGRVDPGKTMFDGQTVKTRMMYRLLCESYGKDNVVVVDTYDYRHRAPAVMADFARCLAACDCLIVLLSKNGRRFFFPLLSFSSRHLGKRVYHNLIGGWLADNLEKYPRWVKYLNSFEVNWVEAHALVGRLSEKGVHNAEYLPNFKYFERRDDRDMQPCPHPDGVFHFCTFSRVMEQKGITDAATAVESLCSEGHRCRLDVYGPVDERYRGDFESLLKTSPHVEYKGCVAPEESVGVISAYDALLFPTKWKPEGIPGTIVDALAAGVPVIAGKWQYHDEMLEDGVTGFGYPLGDCGQLKGAMRRYMALQDNSREEMSRACARRVGAYSPEAVKAIVCRELSQWQ